jgi:hypothetical protein
MLALARSITKKRILSPSVYLHPMDHNLIYMNNKECRLSEIGGAVQKLYEMLEEKLLPLLGQKPSHRVSFFAKIPLNLVDDLANEDAGYNFASFGGDAGHPNHELLSSIPSAIEVLLTSKQRQGLSKEALFKDGLEVVDGKIGDLQEDMALHVCRELEEIMPDLAAAGKKCSLLSVPPTNKLFSSFYQWRNVT